ncbi:MAG: type I methionyl aminopeptidase [Clostridiales bacterium]|nr:type I methionyl aminopeptidase [Clostridiales bacterium]
MISLKNPDQLAKMRSAGHLLYDVLMAAREFVSPGITTMDLNAFVDEKIRKGGGIPTELGYCGYPASICASVDDEVVHGIPSRHVTLKEGSIISVDVTLALDGWQADSAFTAPVGKISEDKQKLIRVTEECFWKGARAAVNGNRIGDIGHAVQSHAEAHGYGVVRDLTGHGIGREMHEDPSVPNFGFPGHGVRIRPCMTFCVEPMIAMGTWRVHQLADGWTIVTNDHAPAAHYEHTLAVTPHGLPELLTLPGAVWKEAEA